MGNLSKKVIFWKESVLENREAQREWKVESRSKFSGLRTGVMVKSERVLRALEQTCELAEK